MTRLEVLSRKRRLCLLLRLAWIGEAVDSRFVFLFEAFSGPIVLELELLGCFVSQEILLASVWRLVLLALFLNL